MRTVIKDRPVHGGLLSVAVAGSLLLGATGCGGGGDEDGSPDGYKVVTATQLCGGDAVSTEAAKALEVITGSSRFEASGEEYSIEQAATTFADTFMDPHSRRGDVCRIYTPRGTSDFELRIRWWREDGAPSTDEPPASKFTVLKMGEDTVTAADKAYLQFACESDELTGSSTPAHIMIGVERGDEADPPKDDVKALKDAYATVAHSVSLAMAKELGCANNGGLPAKPVLDPA
ncbi:hypothetical protein [Streptomyces sp. OM5714]|uniref:hypothetical protein n=1 Tax=Streptomyces sp. OM5714 TaxID=2602736 RepID=UPI00196A19CB|nr:hypothetical protein [Streptomyces sp. OM5714]